MYKRTCVCVFLYQKKRVRAVHCAALVRKKKVRVFSLVQHTQGDKLGIFLGGVLGATTTES